MRLIYNLHKYSFGSKQSLRVGKFGECLFPFSLQGWGLELKLKFKYITVPLQPYFIFHADQVRPMAVVSSNYQVCYKDQK